MRTLQSWKSSSFILSLIACRLSVRRRTRVANHYRLSVPSGQRRREPYPSHFPTRIGSACCSRAGKPVSHCVLKPQVHISTKHRATHVELLGCAAEGGVVLLDKVPTDLVLGDLRLRVGGGRGWGGRGCCGCCLGVGLRGVLLLVEVLLGRVGAVDGHG